MKILITGSSGFLGSSLALYWKNLGHQVSLLLRPTSRLDRLKGEDFYFDIGLCSSDNEVEDFVKKVQADVIVHTACVYGRKNENSLQLFDSNMRLGLVILQAIRKISKPVNFINTGSALPSHVSEYALSKHQFSQWGGMLAANSNNQLKFVNVLLQHMYGPGDDESKFTSHILHTCLRNDAELNLTAGNQVRDFIYIDDVISAYDVLIQESSNFENFLDVEIGTGIAPTIRNFVETAHRLTASKTKLLFGAVPYRDHEVMSCIADIGYMQGLGWSPVFDIESGLQKMLEMEGKK